MAYLLHIESTSTVCSVALSAGPDLVSIKELNDGYTHAENLHVFIQDLLNECSLKPHQLNAISVSTGPGSYTGLRIGYAAAKGLAFALNIPLITVSTMKALTSLAMKKEYADALYCPMLDARRMEVYCSMFTNALQEQMPVTALVLTEESIQVLKHNTPIYFFGDGMPKAKELLQTIPQSFFIDGILASATALVPLAWKKYMNQEFEDTAYAEPLYVKDFFFNTVKKN